METLAQKAGITFDEKYDDTYLPEMDNAQIQNQPQQVMISDEQFQQYMATYGQNGQPTGIQMKQNLADDQYLLVIDESAPNSHQHHTPNSRALDIPQTQQNTTTMATISPLQLQNNVVYWGSRDQVSQQPCYLSTQYIPQMIMPNMIHPGLGNQSIQVITKPLQSNPFTPQMLTQNKSVIGNGANGFSGTYTMPTSQAQLVFSPYTNGVTEQATQQELSETSATSNGQEVLQKVPAANSAGQTLTNSANPVAVAAQQQNQQSVQVSSAVLIPLQQNGAQQIQFTDQWLLDSESHQFGTSNGFTGQTALEPNLLLIYSDSMQDMFLSPQHQQMTTQDTPSTPQNQQAVQTRNTPQQKTLTTIPNNVAIQQQQSIQSAAAKGRTVAVEPKQTAQSPHTLLATGQQVIRPTSPVSTQTAPNQQQLGAKKPYVWTKQVATRPPVPNLKSDASNQTKVIQQILTSAGSKTVGMSSNGAPMNISNANTNTITTQQHQRIAPMLQQKAAHLIQPSPDPLQVMNSMSYNATSETILQATKDDKQQKKSIITTEEHLLQTAAAATLMSMSGSTTNVNMSPAAPHSVTHQTIYVSPNASNVKSSLKPIESNMAKTSNASPLTTSNAPPSKATFTTTSSPAMTVTISTFSATTSGTNTNKTLTVSPAAPTKIAAINSHSAASEAETNNNNSLTAFNAAALNVIKSDKDLLPKTAAKSHVLTYIIEGMHKHIQEGSEPFPMNRKRYSDESDGPSPKHSKISKSPDKIDGLSCANCGKTIDGNDPEQEEQSYLVKWTVEEVSEFIRSLDQVGTTYSDYADDFLDHEIDGQVLILLNENHLVNYLKIRLGPALKILHKIEAIKNNPPPTTNFANAVSNANPTTNNSSNNNNNNE